MGAQQVCLKDATPERNERSDEQPRYNAGACWRGRTRHGLQVHLALSFVPEHLEQTAGDERCHDK
jgi:hypothetical protein